MDSAANPQPIVAEQIIIPARGGSKGVPGKNLLSIGGRTLIANAVLRSLSAGVDRVVVTTDCDDIAMAAAGAGAKIVARPAELATDTSMATDAIRHALEQYPCRSLAIVQCTSPMLDARDIRGCLDKLHRGVPVPPFDSRRVAAYDLVICCVEFDGLILSAHGELVNQRLGCAPNRQQRPTQWLVNGNCWACRPEYLAEREWMSGHVGIVPAQYPHRLEIDTPADVALAHLVVGERSWSGYPFD